MFAHTNATIYLGKGQHAALKRVGINFLDDPLQFVRVERAIESMITSMRPIFAEIQALLNGSFKKTLKEVVTKPFDRMLRAAAEVNATPLKNALKHEMTLFHNGVNKMALETLSSSVYNDPELVKLAVEKGAEEEDDDSESGEEGGK